MINSLWISKTGMEAQQTQLDVISNNLANSSTAGFKRSTAVFEDLMYQNLRQVGAGGSEQNQLPTGLQIGLGVRTVGTSRSFKEGNLQETKATYDVAILGNGFLPVTMPDGTTSYTRDGHLQMDGTLKTMAGLAIVGAITVPPTAVAGSVTINSNGTVTYLVGTDPEPRDAGRIQLANFANPAGLDPKGGNLYAVSVASGAPITGAPGEPGFGELKQGFIEGSNVNLVEELVTMIQTQRAYEINSKAIQTSDQMLQKLGQL
jgi:flagellar basal-body rod protein FlgG